VIALIGFMGSGKTTVGRLLAAELRMPFADADELIETQAGKPIARIFAEDGEGAFRALEAEVALVALGGAGVLALGGGAVESQVIRDALRGHTVIWLDVPLDEALARLGEDAGRPVLKDPQLARRYQIRQALYEEVADLRVEAELATAAETAGLIAALVEPASAS
jgi:shikimate kinase